MRVVKIFKLVSGDEVIGQINEDEDKFRKTIHRPRKVMEIFTDKGPAITFRPFVAASLDPEVITLPAGHVMYMDFPTKTVEEAYMRDVSPIVLSKEA